MARFPFPKLLIQIVRDPASTSVTVTMTILPDLSISMRAIPTPEAVSALTIRVTPRWHFRGGVIGIRPSYRSVSDAATTRGV